MPCNYVHQEYWDVGDSVADECISNLTAQKEYLGNFNVLIYMNEQVFKQTEYGESSIIRQSRFFT